MKSLFFIFSVVIFVYTNSVYSTEIYLDSYSGNPHIEYYDDSEISLFNQYSEYAYDSEFQENDTSSETPTIFNLYITPERSSEPSVQQDNVDQLTVFKQLPKLEQELIIQTLVTFKKDQDNYQQELAPAIEDITQQKAFLETKLTNFLDNGIHTKSLQDNVSVLLQVIAEKQQMLYNIEESKKIFDKQLLNTLTNDIDLIIKNYIFGNPQVTASLLKELKTLYIQLPSNELTNY